MRTEDLIRWIEELTGIAIDFDISVDAESIDTSKVMRACGARGLECVVYIDISSRPKKLLRIRN